MKIKIKKRQQREFNFTKLQIERKKIDIKMEGENALITFPFSSEFPVERWGYVEVLSHEPGCMDSVRLENHAPALFNHKWDVQLGKVVKSWVENKIAYVTVKMSRTELAKEKLKDIEDEILVNVSFGYEVIEVGKIIEEQGKLPVYIATKWMPFEVSFVTIPADYTVGLARSLEDGNEEIEIEVVSEVEAAAVATVPPVEPPLAGNSEPPVDDAANPENSKTKILPKITITERKAMTPEEILAMKEKAASDERTRGATISALCEKHNMKDFARTLIDSGKSLAEAKDAIYEKIEGRQPAQVSQADQEVGLSERQKNQFSIVRALNCLANPNDAKAREAAAFELEVSAAAQKRSKKDAQGILIPFDILNHKRRDLTVGGGGSSGGYAVGTEHLGASFVEMLRNKSALIRLGARVLNGLKGDLAIPRQSGAGTAYWIAENANITTESALALGQIAMSPKTIGAYTDYSRKLLIQSSPDIDQLVNDDLANVVALGIDVAGLYGTGADGQPTGVKLTDGINTKDLGAADPTFLEIIEMESLIAADNADVANMKYLVHANGRGVLKGTPKFTSTGTPIWEAGNTVNGYGAEVSNQVTSGDFFFGNWADLLIGLWSGLDLTADKAAGALAGTTRIIALQDVDFAVRHPESFCRANNTL